MKIKELFEKICALIREKNQLGFGISSPQAKQLDQHLHSFKDALIETGVIPGDWSSNYSIGKGNLASVMWVVFLPPNQTTQDGIYVSLCFGKTGNGLVAGCTISNTSKKKYSFVPTVSRKNPTVDVNGTRPGTHYNDGYVNPKEFLSDSFDANQLIDQLKESVEVCNKTLALASTTHIQAPEELQPKHAETTSDDERYAIWKKFLEKWPAKRIDALTLDEYTTYGEPYQAFCNWIEWWTEKLGSVWGGSSYKFGVFRQDPNGDVTRDSTHDGDGTYKWYKCYGSSAADVFSYVKKTFSSIAEAVSQGDLDAIDSVSFGHAIKWKIAFLYQSMDNPIVIPIYSKKMLSSASGLPMSAKTSDMYRKLMSEKPDGMDIFEYSDFLGRRLWGEGREETPEDLPEELSVNNQVRDVGSLGKEELKAFCEFLKNEKHLTYSESFVRRFIAAVQAKNFVVLTGLSGSGKTQLAMAFCEWMTNRQIQGNSNAKLVAVGADWTNNEKMLGYPDAMHMGRYVHPDTGILDLVLSAAKNPSNPYFLVLDEMNLSHVERYFADFLSAMESGDSLRLHGASDVMDGVPPSIVIPKNLWVIGTMNVDETTYMFSPKVLDRAQVLEFRVSAADMAAYLGDGVADETLKDFFPELAAVGTEFGYRTAKEFKSYVESAQKLGAPDEEALDAAIMQKLLPKLHGSRKQLAPVLKKLWELCLKRDENGRVQPNKLENAVRNDTADHYDFDVNARYPLSAQKIFRMYVSAEANGFASYAEA